MITVKFFGLLNLDNNVKQLLVSKGKLRNIIDEIIVQCPSISEKELLQSIMFINKKQTVVKKSLSMEINDGEEIAFISPSSGG